VSFTNANVNLHTEIDKNKKINNENETNISHKWIRRLALHLDKRYIHKMKPNISGK
jgi:hypothetical protein